VRGVDAEAHLGELREADRGELGAASAACSWLAATITTSRSGSSAKPQRLPNPVTAAESLNEPAMWPSAKCAPSRTSSTWASAAGSVTVRGRGGEPSSGPRLSSTMCAMVGGLGERSAFAFFTKSSTAMSASIGLKRRS